MGGGLSTFSGSGGRDTVCRSGMDDRTREKWDGEMRERTSGSIGRAEDADERMHVSIGAAWSTPDRRPCRTGPGLVSGGGLPRTESGSNTTRRRRTGAGCQPRACVDGPRKSFWPPHAWSTVQVGWRERTRGVERLTWRTGRVRSEAVSSGPVLESIDQLTRKQDVLLLGPALGQV
jgi:hypothetical protein